MSDPQHHGSDADRRVGAASGTPPSADMSGLAGALEPALCGACEGRLSGVQWFKSSWQAGGAATGYAKYAPPGMAPVDVVVKFPIGPSEFRWTTGLGMVKPEELRPGEPLPPPGPTPRVYAAGTELGGYDLAWIVLERLGGAPLSASLTKDGIEGLLHAAAEWYSRSVGFRELSGDAAMPPPHDWEGLLGKARDAIRNSAAHLPEPHRWKESVRNVQRHLSHLLRVWDLRPVNCWCHGDLHPGNAMVRGGGGAAAGGMPVVLIDLALVHAGNWVEDAVYLERLYWARPEMLCGVKPVSFLAKARRDRGLSTSEDYTMLANIRRVLMAACVPAFLGHEGHPKYVRAALETLERHLPLVARL